MFVVELVLPFLIFFPRRLRFAAGFGILLLEGCILLTGNYNWFNLQTMLLCLPLFDDAALRRILPSRLLDALPVASASQEPRRAVTIFVNAVALHYGVLKPRPDGRAIRRQPAWVGAGDR